MAKQGPESLRCTLRRLCRELHSNVMICPVEKPAIELRCARESVLVRARFVIAGGCWSASCKPPAEHSMSLTGHEPTAGIYLLSDHLDAALAMGEDLLTEKAALAAPTQHLTVTRLARQNRDIAEFLKNVRTLELTMTARLLQARKRAQDLKRVDSRLRPLIALFAAGTTALCDAAAELGDSTEHDFDTGDVASAFLRSRGLSELKVSEEYLVAGRIRLGTLLDLVATFLDTLDLMFDLYGAPMRSHGAGERPSPLASDNTR